MQSYEEMTRRHIAGLRLIQKCGMRGAEAKVKALREKLAGAKADKRGAARKKLEAAEAELAMLRRAAAEHEAWKRERGIV